MATFIDTIQPTPFGYFDAEPGFQFAADSLVTFVKRRLGDDVLSVELTRKQIWASFEEASLEYARLIQESRIKSDLVNVLGQPTGSKFTNKYSHKTFDHLMRMAEPYAQSAGIGGSYDSKLGFINLEVGKQDYNLYSDLKSDVQPGDALFDTLPSGSKGHLKIVEIFHFEPMAAQQMLINASNMTNFLATNFNYESYVNSSVFYVLPVFEDVLRRGMLEEAFRVRRSHYNWLIQGTNLRIFPIPTSAAPYLGKLYVRVMPPIDPLKPSFDPMSENGGDDSIDGISGPHNAPYGIIPYDSITEPGRQWIRQYTLALCTEILGRIRNKFSSIPIPNADLTLNGNDLISQAREDKEKLTTQMVEWLAEMTTEKLAEREANLAENINRQLRYVPMPMGGAIIIG